MHRSQGATCDLAHVYEDGGGRELAYVAMSRAREQTNLYLAADDLAQAREDLERSWAQERRWRWAIDTGTPELPRSDRAVRREALVAEYRALAAAVPRDVSLALRRAIVERDDAARELQWLRHYRGLHAKGELGQAADELATAGYRRNSNELNAKQKELPRAIRREARRARERLELAVTEARAKVAPLLAHEDRRLAEILEQAEHTVAPLAQKDGEHSRWSEAHPEVPDRLKVISTEVSWNEYAIHYERRDVEHELNPEPERAYVVEHEHYSSHDHDYDRDIDRDYGFGL